MRGGVGWKRLKRFSWSLSLLLTLNFFLLVSSPSRPLPLIKNKKTKNKTAEPDVKTLETMRKFSEQFAKR